MMARDIVYKEEEYVTHSERETFLLARNLAKGFKGKEVVLLIGELGAGKTVFAKGIASGLGLKDIHQVCSPSFTIVNIYQAKYAIYHVDLYRLGNNREIVELGLEDYLGEGVVIIEWGEKIKFALDAIRVTFEMGKGDERTIKISF